MGRSSTILGLRRGEARRALLLAASLLTIVASYTMVKAVRDAVFLTSFGSAELALVYISLAVAAGGVAALGTRLTHHLPGIRRMAAMHVAVAASLLGLWEALRHDVAGMAWVLYVWSACFGLFLLANFWLLANQLYDARSARRVFPILGAGAILGGVVGGQATTLATRLGAVNLLPLVAAGLIAAAALSAAAAREDVPSPLPGPAPPRLADSVQIVRRSSYLRLIAGLLLLATIATTIVDLQLKTVAKEHFGADRDAMAAFFGNLTKVFSLVSLLVQLFVTPLLLRRLGVGRALLVLPAALALGAGAILFHGILALPMLTATAIAKIGDGGLRFSLDKAATELLYLPVPADVKLRAKPIIDTVADRAGTALTGVLWLAVLALGGGAGVGSVVLGSCAVLGVLVLWLVVAVRARAGHVQAFRAALPAPAAADLAPRRVLRLDAATLDRLMLDEARTYAEHLTELRAAVAADRPALTRRLEDDRARIFHLLLLRYGERDVRAAYDGLRQAEPATRASALELLDNLLEHPVRRNLIRLLDEETSTH